MYDLLELHHHENTQMLFIAASEVGSIERLEAIGENSERTRITLKVDRDNKLGGYVFLVSEMPGEIRGMISTIEERQAREKSQSLIFESE